eukprot:11965051-Karenia_brevis.AAC.1
MRVPCVLCISHGCLRASQSQHACALGSVLLIGVAEQLRRSMRVPCVLISHTLPSYMIRRCVCPAFCVSRDCHPV